MKKITAIILAVTMLFGMLGIVAFADTDTVGTEVATGEYETPYTDSRFFSYGDYTIHFRVLEAADEKDRIMMVHGFALSGYCWQELATRLVAGGYTCVLVDLPDFGYSTRENSSTNRLPREEIVHALMTYLSDEPWIVAGHSMGGYVALSIMQNYPESVSALMLYGTSGYDGMSDGMKTMFANPVVAKLMGAFMDMAAGNDFIFNMILRYALNDDAYYNSYDKAMVKEPARIKGTGRGAVYSFVSVNPTDFEALATCGKPIFFINGSADKVIQQSAKDKLISYLPDDAVVKYTANGGHMFIEAQADEVAAETLTFLGGIA